MTTINGYRILASHHTPAREATREGAVLLVDRGEDSPHRYVTAWAGTGDKEWCWGHYYSDLAEATEDYASRSDRGY